MTDSVEVVEGKDRQDVSSDTPTDNYPILVAEAPLPVLREQAERFRRYLADDSNTFDGAWLEERRRRLDAVRSYVRNRQLRAEISQCQRWVELRIGEWLGPAKIGRPEKGSCDEPSFGIHKAHKHEFRFLAERKALTIEILEKYDGQVITRAMLLAEIGEAALREHAPHEWSEEELARRERVEAGITVVATLRGARDKHLLNWAKSKGLLIRVGRGTPWGNPFEIPDDGDRDTVCNNYAWHHLLHRPSLLNEIHSLKGKVLACWCYPERCHGDYLAEWANNTDPEAFKSATRTLGIVAEFRELTLSANPARALAGLKDHEKSALLANLRGIGGWIDSVEQKETVLGL